MKRVTTIPCVRFCYPFQKSEFLRPFVSQPLLLCCYCTVIPFFFSSCCFRHGSVSMTERSPFPSIPGHFRMLQTPPTTRLAWLSHPSLRLLVNLMLSSPIFQWLQSCPDSRTIMPPDWLYAIFLTVFFAARGVAIQLDIQDERKLLHSAPYCSSVDSNIPCTSLISY